MAKLIKAYDSAEIVPIPPEHLEVANAYLSTGSIEDAAALLGIDTSRVTSYLNKREVKAYIDAMYMDAGYRNRTKLAAVLDKVIDAKLIEMEEAGVGSNKDIVDILTLAHKFRMEELKMQKEMLAHHENIGKQVNVQINNSNYGDLLSQLTK